MYLDNIYFAKASSPKSSQTITYPVIADKTLGDVAFNLTATASSGLAVSYTTTSDKVTISGAQVTLVKAGRATITANQTGNASFTAATSVDKSFCISPAKPTIAISGENTETTTLTSSAAAGNQWFLNGSVITGATNKTFVATGAGIYKVQAKVDDCVSAFSTDAPLIVTGDINTFSKISVYPNPAEGYLEVSGLKGDVSSTQLFDMSGRSNAIQFTRNNDILRADVNHLSKGFYLLQIQEGNQLHTLKVIKK